MRHSSSWLAALSLLATILANARDARANEKPSADAATEETPSTLLVSASAGSGAGSVGLTGRLGLRVDYWPIDYAGIGLAAGLLGQTDLKLLGSTSEGHWFVGPALGLRTSARPRHAYVTAAAGYMRGRWNHPGDAGFLCLDACYERAAERIELRGLAGAFGAGYATGEGPWGVGVLGMVDLMAPQHAVSISDGTELDASVVSITLNITVNLGLY
jgi:hypothetical protein